MYLISIIDRIYESSHFGTFLTASIVVLLILFIIVFILGIKDSKKDKKVKKIEIEEDVKDITFDMPDDKVKIEIEMDNIKEDVTFEMPSLTKNLENFKKSLEEEIQKEEMAEVRKTSGLILPKEKKTVKILDLESIEDTRISPIKELQEAKKEDEKLKVPEQSPKKYPENNPKQKDSFNKENSNLLETKIFNKEKEIDEIPLIKEGLKPTKAKIEVEIIKEIKEENTIQKTQLLKENKNLKDGKNNHIQKDTKEIKNSQPNKINSPKSQPISPINNVKTNPNKSSDNITPSKEQVNINANLGNNRQNKLETTSKSSHPTIEKDNQTILQNRIKKESSNTGSGTYSNDDDF